MAAFILSVNCISAQNLTRWVNPFIGTGAVQSSLSGHNYPGATVPFGMVPVSYTHLWIHFRSGAGGGRDGDNGKCFGNRTSFATTP